MNIFEYLLTDERHIQEKLHTVADNYADWPQPKVFDGVRHAIDSVTAHVTKVNNILLRDLPNEAMGGLTAKWKELAQSIEDSIENLTQIHVDEPGFEQLFIHLSRAFDSLAGFEQEELFPALKKNAKEDDIDRWNANLESMVFS
ncbi:MAG: hypothetical protein K2X77_30595 [Candidatus Obscuribacterales bacterium]|nr:hypothetical protein [Candidatus Obscuribacterales bacterium]